LVRIGEQHEQIKGHLHELSYYKQNFSQETLSLLNARIQAKEDNYLYLKQLHDELSSSCIKADLSYNQQIKDLHASLQKET